MQLFLPVDVDDAFHDDNGMVEASVVGDLPSCDADQSREPYEGMVFESEAAARAYYDEYAGQAGFLTRVLSSRKSERDGSIISRGLGCRNMLNAQKSANISGDMGEKRSDGCTAMLLIKREDAERWVVRKFVRDHNHPLVVSLPKRRPTFVSMKILISTYFIFPFLGFTFFSQLVAPVFQVDYTFSIWHWRVNLIISFSFISTNHSRPLAWLVNGKD